MSFSQIDLVAGLLKVKKEFNHPVLHLIPMFEYKKNLCPCPFLNGPKLLCKETPLWSSCYFTLTSCLSSLVGFVIWWAWLSLLENKSNRWDESNILQYTKELVKYANWCSSWKPRWSGVLLMFPWCAVSILPDEIPLILVEPLPGEIKKQGPFPPGPNFNRVFLATGAPPGAQLGGLGRGLNEAWVLSWRKILWHCSWQLNDLPSASKKCIRGYKNLFKSDLLGCSSESGACNTICTFVKLNFRFSNCCCQPCTCNEEAFCATLDIFKTSLQFIDFKMNLFFGRDLYRLKILLCNFHFVQNWIWSLKLF